MEYKKEFISNKYGIKIVKCCASCRNKKIDKDKRCCVLDGSSVTTDYLCPDWVMEPSLDKVGRGDGHVKKKKYIEFALEHHGQSLLHGPLSVANMRSEYSKKNGSLYVENL